MSTVWFHLQEVSRGVKSRQTERRWSRAGDLWFHAQSTYLGKMRWLWRWRLVTVAQQCEWTYCTWTVHQKMLKTGDFMLCVFYHQFLKVVGIPKDCPETLLSWRRYLPPSPGVHYLQPVNIGVSQRLCTNHVAVLWESFQQAVRGSVSTRTMLRALPSAGVTSPSPSPPFTHPHFSIHSGCLNTMQRIFLNLGFIRQGLISWCKWSSEINRTLVVFLLPIFPA